MKARARQLRRAMTDAEITLWQLLRNRKFHGFKFRRQYSIGSYIVDFICISKKLIIELDGSQHLHCLSYDNNRTAYFQNLGYRVIRFWNDAVFNERGIRKDILCFKWICPHPALRATFSRERENGSWCMIYVCDSHR